MSCLDQCSAFKTMGRESRCTGDCWLVGGLGHFLFFHNIWDNPSHWLLFFRGVETTNPLALNREPSQVTNQSFWAFRFWQKAPWKSRGQDGCWEHLMEGRRSPIPQSWSTKLGPNQGPSRILDDCRRSWSSSHHQPMCFGDWLNRNYFGVPWIIEWGTYAGIGMKGSMLDTLPEK